MTSTSHLVDQLSRINESVKATNTLITRLGKLAFDPGTESLEDPSSARIELAQDIHDNLKQLDEDLELLKQEAEDLGTGGTSGGYRRRESSDDRDRERTRLTAHVAKVGEDLRSSRAHFRRAQLNAKKAAELAKQKGRELLFATLSAPEEGRQTPDLFAGRRTTGQPKRTTKEEQEVDASASITASLRRTHDLLSTELSRSRFAQETFDQSTAALAELSEKYDSLDSVLKSSRDLLGTLLRSQKSDTWYLETAFYILVTTLIWLIFRRLLLGPFIRLPLFLFNWFLWKPLIWFFYLTGVITTEAATSTALRSSLSSTTRTPLIIQPSAGRDSIPRFDAQMAEQLRKEGGIPVGAGGPHAKNGKQAGLSGSMSEKIAKMAQDRNDAQGQVKRGDGTVLQDRGDIPRNPKKKMFEADVEDAKTDGRQEAQEKGKDKRERDEL